MEGVTYEKPRTEYCIDSRSATYVGLAKILLHFVFVHHDVPTSFYHQKSPKMCLAYNSHLPRLWFMDRLGVNINIHPLSGISITILRIHLIHPHDHKQS